MVQTQASTAFAVAAMLTYGRLDYEMGDTHRSDPRIMALIERITIVPNDGGGPEDAVVEVETEDGRAHRREARESERTLLYQDGARATEVFEERLVRSGLPVGLGKMLAGEVLGLARDGAELSVRTIIDRLQGGAGGRA
jgi:hypothetical protein